MFIITLLKSRLGQLAIVGLTCGAVGGYLHKRLVPPTFVTDVIHDTKNITVDRPVLTEKIVTQFVSNPAQAKALAALVKENHDLKTKVTNVTTTEANLQTTGGTNQGGSISRPDSQIPSGDVLLHGSRSEGTFEYVDYQLEATYGPTTFSYKLGQKFVIQTSTGKDPDRKVVSRVNLFQDTPTGLKPIPTTTVSINSDPDAPRWMVSPRVQGGLSLNPKGGFVGLQLLKRGTSRDPKDLKWAVGTVGVGFGNGSIEPLVLPVSFNLGSIPKQPFSNIWVSPGVDKVGKVRIVLSATF